LDCFTNRYWNHLVESAYWLFRDALHSRFNPKYRISIGYVVEETTNPSPNELGEMDNTWAIHQLLLQLILHLKRYRKLVHWRIKSPNRAPYFPKHQSRTLW
jgi:hypothetical protein